MPSNRRIRHKTKKRFKKTWGHIVDGLGRQIVVYLPGTERECPICYYDKVNRSSSGVCKVSFGEPYYFTVGRCQMCFGKGVLITIRKRCMDGIVTWNPRTGGENSLTFSEAGYEGATKVEVKTDPCHLELIKEAAYVKIDGIQCRLSNPPITRGVGGKHILTAQFFTVAKPKKESGEII